MIFESVYLTLPLSSSTKTYAYCGAMLKLKHILYVMTFLVANATGTGGGWNWIGGEG